MMTSEKINMFENENKSYKIAGRKGGERRGLFKITFNKK